MSSSFQRMATVAFTTKRPAALAGGKRGEPTAHLTSEDLRCTPLDPADPGGKGALVERLILESKVQLLETFVAGELDIRRGDVLVVGGVDYPIKAAGRWTWGDSQFRYLIVEDLER